DERHLDVVGHNTDSPLQTGDQSLIERLLGLNRSPLEQHAFDNQVTLASILRREEITFGHRDEPMKALALWQPQHVNRDTVNGHRDVLYSTLQEPFVTVDLEL